MTRHQVNPQSVLENEVFRYRDDISLWPYAEELRQSIQRRGVIVPLKAVETDAGYQIVSGFKRLHLARSLKLPRIPIEVTTLPPADVLQTILEEHLGQPINLREKALAIQKGRELGLSIDEISQRVLPPLGLKAHPALVEQHLNLLKLPPALLQLFVEKNFSLRRCLPFCNWSYEDNALLACVAKVLKLGGRQIEEISTWLMEIVGRDSESLSMLVKDLHLLPAQGGKDEEVSVGAALARIEQRRLPVTSLKRQELEALAGKFAMNNVQLRFDPSLSTGPDGALVEIRNH
jgi:hypothetical protein